MGPVNQPDYDVPIASEHREEGKLAKIEEQPSYDIPISYTKDILTESDQCRNIKNSKFCKSELDNNAQVNRNRISKASVASLGSEQHQTSYITNESLDQPDYDIPESLHQPDYDVPVSLDQPDYDVPVSLDQPDYDVPISLDQPDYDIPESHENALYDKSKSSNREETRVVLASNCKNYDISNVNRYVDKLNLITYLYCWIRNRRH